MIKLLSLATLFIFSTTLSAACDCHKKKTVKHRAPHHVVIHKDKKVISKK